MFCPPTHLGCGCLLHIWLLAKADTVLLGLWPRGTHICALSYCIIMTGSARTLPLSEGAFPVNPTRAALLTWHLEIYADKSEDVTLVGVSVILSHDSWLPLGEMASARLLFCKLGLLKEDFTGRALNPCDDLSCLVQPLSPRFSKHSCQVVMIVIPLLLLNLICGKEEPFLLLSYFTSSFLYQCGLKYFWGKIKSELTENALHMVLDHCLGWPEISALRFLEFQTKCETRSLTRFYIPRLKTN